MEYGERIRRNADERGNAMMSAPAHDPPPIDSATAGPFTASADLSLKELERRHIEQVVADSQTLVEAAARLGIDTATLWRKRKRYGMK